MYCRLTTAKKQTLTLTRWEHLYISPRPAYRTTVPHDSKILKLPSLLTLNLGPSPPFRIKSSAIWWNTSGGAAEYTSLHPTFVTQTTVPWTGHPPIELHYEHPLLSHQRKVVLRLGRCTSKSTPSRSRTQDSIHSPVIGSHYAVVNFVSRGEHSRPSTAHGTCHSCQNDHVVKGFIRIIQGGNTWGKFSVRITRDYMNWGTMELDIRLEVQSLTSGVHM